MFDSVKFQNNTITKSTKKLTLKNQNVEIDIVRNSSVKVELEIELSCFSEISLKFLLPSEF